MIPCRKTSALILNSKRPKTPTRLNFLLKYGGMKYRAEDREDLLRIVYMMRQLRHKQEI